MRAGDLDRRIEIQVPQQSTDSLGGPVTMWTFHARVWAQVLPASGNERFLSQQREATRIYRFRIRKLQGLSERCRIVYSGRAWNIVSILELERGAVIEVTAETSDRAEDQV